MKTKIEGEMRSHKSDTKRGREICVWDKPRGENSKESVSNWYVELADVLDFLDFFGGEAGKM